MVCFFESPVNKGLKLIQRSPVIESKSLELDRTKVLEKNQDMEGKTVQVTNAYRSTENARRVSGGDGTRHIGPQRARAANRDVVRISDAAHKADHVAEIKRSTGRDNGIGPVSRTRVLSFALVRFRAAESNAYYQPTQAATDSIVTTAGDEISVRTAESARPRNDDVQEESKVEEVRAEEPSPVADDSPAQSTTPDVAPLHSVESTDSPDPTGNLGRYTDSDAGHSTVTFVV